MREYSSLDYTAMSAEPTQEAIDKQKPSIGFTLVMLVIFLPIGFLGGWVLVGQAQREGIAAIIPGVVLLAFFAVLTVGLPLIYRTFLSMKPAAVLGGWGRIEAFAAANLFTPVDDPSYEGTVVSQSSFSVGGRSYSDGTLEFGEITYSNATMSSVKAVIQQPYARVRITGALPHILFDAKANDTKLLGHQASNLEKMLPNMNPLETHLPIDDFFTTYADTLESVTQVVDGAASDVLVRASERFDVECTEHYVYVYVARNYDWTQPTDLRVMLDTVVELAQVLNAQQLPMQATTVSVDNSLTAAARQSKRNKLLATVVSMAIGALLVALTSATKSHEWLPSIFR